MSNLNKTLSKPTPTPEAVQAKPAALLVRATRDAIYDSEQHLWIDHSKATSVQSSAFIQGHLDSKSLEIVCGA